MPIEMLNKLPAEAKKIWETTFKAAKAKVSVEQAARVAMSAVKKSFKQSKGKWVTKSMALKITLVKSGILFPQYKFLMELTNDKKDSEGQRVRPELLYKLYKNNLIDKVGDVDHEKVAKEYGEDYILARAKLTQDIGTEGLYFLDDVKYIDNKIKAVVTMNKKHPLFNKYLALHKKGEYLYASAEFENAKFNSDGEIIDADKMGWTITNNPLNLDAKAISQA